MELEQIMSEDTKAGGYYKLQFKDDGKRTPYVWLYKQSEKGIAHGDGVYIPDNPINGYIDKNVTFAYYIEKPNRCVITAMSSEDIQYFEYCIYNKYISPQAFQELKPKQLPIFN